MSILRDWASIYMKLERQRGFTILLNHCRADSTKTEWVSVAFCTSWALLWSAKMNSNGNRYKSHSAGTAPNSSNFSKTQKSSSQRSFRLLFSPLRKYENLINTGTEFKIPWAWESRSRKLKTMSSTSILSPPFVSFPPFVSRRRKWKNGRKWVFLFSGLK